MSKRILFVVTLCAAQFASAQATQPPNTVEIWVRAPGQHAHRDLARLQLQVINLRTLPLAVEKRFDLQYRTEHTFRGIALAALLAKHIKSFVYDTAVLHFENGMRVPLTLKSGGGLDATSPFVALDIQAPNAQGRAGWNSQLPDVRKQGAENRDSRPIRFHGNKIVVSAPGHPSLAPGESDFSPWLHVDRLTGVELVKGQAYQDQFAPVMNGPATRGHLRFVQYCQFCHGARRVGAHFGWDFVEPVPIIDFREPKSLFLHLRYRETDAAERGLMMPALSKLHERDAEDLWEYLKALTDQPPLPYFP